MRKRIRILIIFILPIFLMLPTNVQGHIVSEAETFNLALTPEVNFNENKDGLVQLRKPTQLLRLSQLNSTFLFDPILISFQLSNWTQYIDNSSYFNDDFSKLKIELIVIYFILEKGDYVEYTNETHLVSQKDPETIDFFHVFDPSVQFPDTRDMIDNSTILELWRDEPIFRINVDFKLKFSSLSFRNLNMDFRLHSTIISYHPPSIPNSMFHNKITGHLSSLPVIMTMNWNNFLNSYRLYVPIPMDLTSNFMRTTLASHNKTTIPKMRMKFSLQIIDLEKSFEDSFDNSLEEDSIKLQISRNQSRLKEKHILNQTYEYTYDYVPGEDQIVVFDLVNYGNSIEIRFQSIEIQIPALFFEPDYNAVELIWIFIVRYKYLAIFVSITILAAAERYDRMLQEEFEASKYNVDGELVYRKESDSGGVWVGPRQGGNRGKVYDEYGDLIKPTSIIMLPPEDEEGEGNNVGPDSVEGIVGKNSGGSEVSETEVNPELSKLVEQIDRDLEPMINRVLEELKRDQMGRAENPYEILERKQLEAEELRSDLRYFNVSEDETRAERLVGEKSWVAEQDHPPVESPEWTNEWEVRREFDVGPELDIGQNLSELDDQKVNLRDHRADEVEFQHQEDYASQSDLQEQAMREMEEHQEMEERTWEQERLDQQNRVSLGFEEILRDEDSKIEPWEVRYGSDLDRVVDRTRAASGRNLEKSVRREEEDVFLDPGASEPVVVPDAIERAWGLLIAGYSIGVIASVTGLDRAYLGELFENKSRLNALVNSVGARKKFNQKQRRIARRAMVARLKKMVREALKEGVESGKQIPTFSKEISID